MAIAHWHRFLVLTKRADRMRVYYADPQTPYRIAVAVDDLAATVLPGLGFGSDGAAATAATARSVGAGARRLWGAGLARVIRQPAGAQSGKSSPAGLHPWPLPNLWPGVSVEDQGWIDRIGHLLQTPAALRWACFEPLLGPVGPDAVPVGEGYVDALIGDRYLLDGRGRMVPAAESGWRPLDWVVAGGETGAGARPIDPDWVRALRDRCVAAGVPFLFKQWGEWAPVPDNRFGQRMARVGRRNAGRLIDGRCWNQMPAAMLKSGSRLR
jgi:protein gp37